MCQTLLFLNGLRLLAPMSSTLQSFLEIDKVTVATRNGFK
jgi:hypothetical protein